MKSRLQQFLKRANEDEKLADLVAVVVAGLMFCVIAGVHTWLN